MSTVVIARSGPGGKIIEEYVLIVDGKLLAGVATFSSFAAYSRPSAFVEVPRCVVISVLGDVDFEYRH